MEKMTIYYFSATGNSLQAASVIASRSVGAQVIAIREKEMVNIHPDSRKVGFVFPVYMGTLPELVKQFLSAFPFQQDVYYFAVSTYYTYRGVALQAANRILRNKGVKLHYTNALSTVGTCLMEYEVSAQDRIVRLEKADVQLQQIAGDIAKEVQTKPLHSSRLLTKGHEKLFDMVFKNTYKKFSLEDSCIGCGKCVQVCPAGNISLDGKKPVWEDHCMSCHACVHWCPKNAVTLGKSKGRLTYHHPQVSFKQLIEMRDK